MGTVLSVPDAMVVIAMVALAIGLSLAAIMGFMLTLDWYEDR